MQTSKQRSHFNEEDTLQGVKLNPGANNVASLILVREKRCGVWLGLTLRFLLRDN
jgi:hypothetical protein